MSPYLAAAVIIASYLAGSVPCGLILARRLRGTDVRTIGSGNIGATNVARAVGARLGIVAMILDMLKGVLPVLAVRLLWLHDPQGPAVTAAAGLAAILGHVFPIWLGFHGGKGVATAFGVFLVVAPVPALLIAVIWAVLFAILRISSVSALAATTALPLILAVSHAPAPFIILAASTWGLIVARHRTNVRRLLRHEEGKL